MRKTIAKVTPAMHGHLVLEFEDGTKQMVFRGQHEQHAPAAADPWPPDGHEHVTAGVQTGALRRRES